MKYCINNIIVVEGKEDASYLSSFIDAEYVTTNGYEIPVEEVDYLNEASKIYKTIVLVDPDIPGREIEKRLKQKLVNAIYLEVEISRCIRGKKNGVAECEKDEILRVLKPYILDKKPAKTPQIMDFFDEIDYMDKGFRKYLCNKHHLGKCNLKKLFQRIERLGINKHQIKETWIEYNGNK